MDDALKLDKEYIELEKETQEKHNFYYGEVFNMSRGTKRHNELVQEIIINLRSKINKKECKIRT